MPLRDNSGMNTSNTQYKRHRFPAEIIQHSVWLYKMLEPGVFERVLNGDPSVCGRKNPELFRKLRQHLMAYCHLEETAIKRLGADEVRTILDEVRDSIAELRGTE